MLEETIRQASDGRSLSADEAEQALERILCQDVPDDQIASLLVALSEKGETPEEVTGFARAMRRHSLRFETRRKGLVDTAGTGGGAETFNVSTTAAFVIAGAGRPVAKHGNRAVTSKSGSADVLAALGVDVEHPPEVAQRCLDRVGMAFLYAPFFHPAMKRVAGIRRSLGRRTIFNLLGPLTNPLGAPYQVIGVFAPGLTETLAQSLALLGCRRAWVVHSGDGLDELSPCTPSRVSQVRGSQVRTFDFDPAEYGIQADPGSIPRGGSPQGNARITRQVLAGRLQGPARDIVLLNAAAALHLAAGVDFAEALQQARRSIDSGAAAEKLRHLARESRNPAQGDRKQESESGRKRDFRTGLQSS